MGIDLFRASPANVDDYIRIAQQVISRFNCVATTPDGAAKEIEESIVLMIRVDGQVVGFISYYFQSGTRVYISEVQVEPAFQRKGIGGYALDYVIRELPDVEVFELHTHPESSAQHLYSRIGFKATGEVSENHAGTGEPRIKMVFLRE